MTRLDALKELNLNEDAGVEAIEGAYRRLVRRYPPEFHPERFQKVDDAYRFLTSLSDMVERLLSPTAVAGISPEDFDFSAALPPEAVDGAIACLARGAVLAALWPTGRPPVKR